MSRKRQEGFEKLFWPGNYWAGDMCEWQGDNTFKPTIVTVVPENPTIVPSGHVPVMFKENGVLVRKNVPQNRLSIHMPSLKTYQPLFDGETRGVWAMNFIAGDQIYHAGRKAYIAVTDPGTVPLGYVPFYYEDEDEPKKTYCEPAESVYHR